MSTEVAFADILLHEGRSSNSIAGSGKELAAYQTELQTEIELMVKQDPIKNAQPKIDTLHQSTA